MTEPIYREAKVYVNGAPMPNVRAITIAHDSVGATPVTPTAWSLGTYTWEMTVAQRGAFDQLMHALTPPIRGVSDHTLARRVFYGGRKGRRAFKRLLAKGYDAVMMVNEWLAMPVKMGDAK